MRKMLAMSRRTEVTILVKELKINIDTKRFRIPFLGDSKPKHLIIRW
jgi:hypothetical protein